jgi:Carboxypeptidase regulatory-like domain
MSKDATRFQKWAIRLLAAAFTTSLMWGQFTSQVEGTVADPSRAVIPAATITLENIDTGVRSSAQTNSSGYYRFPTLPAGSFNVTVASPSFKSTEVTGIHLELGETRTVNVTLQLGATTSAITIGAEASSVELSDARVSGVIENQQIQALPIAGQNFLSLTILTPGVIGTVAPANVFSGQVQPAINAAGTRQEQNGFSVDGSTVTSMVRHGNTNLQPNEESIQDVRVTVNNFSAEQGSDAGASINVLTKSGTNGYHGSASFFHQDNILTSRTVFQNVPNALTGRVLPVSRRNEWAGSFGGPVIKNKMFLFGSTDILRQASADANIYTVETPQFAQFVEQNFPNNKSAYLFKNFAPSFTPSSSFKTAGSLLGTNCSSLSSPGASITSPIGAIPCNLNVLGNGVSPQQITQAPHQWNVRWDYNIRDQDRLYFQWYRDVAATYTGSTVRPVFSYISPFHNFLGTIDETHTFSPSLINEFRTSAVRTLGNIFCSQCTIPSISITGVTGGFGSGGPTPFSQNNFEQRDNVTWIHGGHTVKAGVQVQRLDANWDPEPGYERPSFSFTSVFNFVLDNPFSEGNIGFNPTNGSVIAPAAAERQTTIQAFGQDTWKITPTFTLTYGLRWEYYGTVAQKTGGQNVEWQTGTDLRSRIADGKDVSKANVFDHAPKLNFAPRLSFAWDPFGTGKTSVRFGTGMFWDALTSQVWGGQHYTPPLYEIVTVAQNLAAPLNQPLYAFGGSATDPYNFPRPPALAGAIGLDSHNGSILAPANIQWDDENLHNPYTLSYFLGIQRALTPTLTLEVNYVGNAGRHLYGGWDQNRYDDSILSNNGVVGHLNPSFGSINYTCACLNSSYNSGNILLRERSNHGLFLQAAYTYGHALDQSDTFGGNIAFIDAWNTRQEKGNSGFDVSQKLALSAVYQIPTPHFSSSLVRGAVGGWQLSGITILQTGARFSVTCSLPFAAVRNSAGAIVGDSGCDYNADGTNNDRPNAPSFAAGSLNYSKQSLISTGVFTASQFPAPCLGCVGNLGRNTYSNPGYADTDLSMQKIFTTPWFTGDKTAHLQVRVDAFNAFNRVNLGGITGDLSNVNFGKVTGASPARTFQLGAKFRF